MARPAISRTFLHSPATGRARRGAPARAGRAWRRWGGGVGVRGTARYIQDVSALAGYGASEAGRARQVWESLEPLRSRIRGKRIFFTGDTGPGGPHRRSR